MKNTNIPRPEYPRPQFVRDEWSNLNGEWQFEIDPGKSGKKRRLFEKASFNKKITAPFCLESKLSGIECKDFMNAVWYYRESEIPETWNGKNVILYFGAVDYESEVWVNSVPVGTHRGGYTPFSKVKRSL